ncbi:DUF4124 domain-containing protein [Pseudoduganella eburnea]|uniref:DUF4124 domain-containing protein n=1 Tax=Massilia eburnea TaxID=1776165 RepID=A0A6L6QMX8_9BURK|nr:DUF4124 domain-containing protein [Massilia eburnea]MTW13046.1 DUF4124 domain-containing protein [Massilia eburnea]
MRLLIISALCATALPAAADDSLYRCIDTQGVVMLTDRPCETLAVAARPVLEKEHFVLPPSEQGRSRWASKPPVTLQPKIDVETLRLARQALALREKVASAR